MERDSSPLLIGAISQSVCAVSRKLESELGRGGEIEVEWGGNISDDETNIWFRYSEKEEETSRRA